MKRLYLVRHAKSSWANPGMADFDRPLNKRGKRDAPAMGHHLKSSREVCPDLVLCSPAKRARATSKRLLKALGCTKDRIVWCDGIYGGSTRDLLSLVHAAEEIHVEVMLIGHNPYMTDLAEDLSGEAVGNMPTCAVFCLDFDVATWSLVGPGSGRKVFYDVPKRI
jgi:phosphohistidine phosphatase